ncbi:hypothetical protein DICSQDRAFT_176152 [Dichomitus squalens LYAD-421 SS1]|uniref:Uncharacterized protein n=1 Tax=Dichomitus squalens (strain LYAD-421) TaxID=732165 RepID=R7SGK4_DICSQ|nr:uncharacterized protein DICSQDRAFT_176152 [Dichomitus squalens LYAD-421 SS1]EJF55284.1 hypothetical protein DICSQDRAFT_176152 [Dichomitus squalens LYAD-421 SS1]
MSKRSCCHISHLPVSEDGRSWPSRGLGFDPGSSTFRYELSAVKRQRRGVVKGWEGSYVAWMIHAAMSIDPHAQKLFVVIYR